MRRNIAAKTPFVPEFHYWSGSSVQTMIDPRAALANPIATRLLEQASSDNRLVVSRFKGPFSSLSGRTLGSHARPSLEARPSFKAGVHRMGLWREGITVDGGPLRPYAEVHAPLVRLRDGEIPEELFADAAELTELCVDLEDHRYERFALSQLARLLATTQSAHGADPFAAMGPGQALGRRLSGDDTLDARERSGSSASVGPGAMDVEIEKASEAPTTDPTETDTPAPTGGTDTATNTASGTNTEAATDTSAPDQMPFTFREARSEANGLPETESQTRPSTMEAPPCAPLRPTPERPASEAAPRRAPGLPTRLVIDPAGLCLQVRLSGGHKVALRVPASWTLQTLVNLVRMRLTPPGVEFDLMTAFPRRVLTGNAEQSAATLGALGLANAALIQRARTPEASSVS